MARRSSLLAVSVVAIVACKGVPFTARPGTVISITANPTTIAVSGGSSVITATVIEMGGTPVANDTVITFITTLGSITPEVKTVDGVARATLTSTGVGGDATISALSGPAKSNDLTVKIGITGTSVALSATPSNLPAGGGTVDLSAVVFGANGAPVPGASVVFSTTQGTLASAGRPVTTDSTGRAVDKLTTTSQAEVTATSGTVSSKATITVGSGGIETLVLAASQVSLPGPGTVQLYATVLGTTGPVPGVAVAWAADAGSLGQPGVTITDANGQATNSLTTSVTTNVTAAAGGKSTTLKIIVGAGTTVGNVAVTAARTSIPAAALLMTLGTSCTPSGNVLPIALAAQVTDQNGNALPNTPVLFYVSFGDLSECGLSFGEFCGGTTSVVTTTNGSGVATAYYTMTQADLEFCNCLPSECACYNTNAPGGSPKDCDTNAPGNEGFGLCPNNSLCRPNPTCHAANNSVSPPIAAADLFCQVSIRAVAGGQNSTNEQTIEYGR